MKTFDFNLGQMSVMKLKMTLEGIGMKIAANSCDGYYIGSPT
ncbi:hypothetical protein ACFLRW_02880 [Acidobacteriota bacterium]